MTCLQGAYILSHTRSILGRNSPFKDLPHRPDQSYFRTLTSKTQTLYLISFETGIFILFFLVLQSIVLLCYTTQRAGRTLSLRIVWWAAAAVNSLAAINNSRPACEECVAFQAVNTETQTGNRVRKEKKFPPQFQSCCPGPLWFFFFFVLVSFPGNGDQTTASIETYRLSSLHSTEGL